MKAKKSIVLTDYRDTENWKLVNDFTIHEDKQLSDRPHMQTKVPKRLWIDLKDVRAVDAYDWSGDNWIGELSVNDDGDLVSDDDQEERTAEYSQKRYVTGRGTFDDKITVFSLKEGALLQFHGIAHIRISAVPPNKIGGKNKATIFDGIGFSGMSSKDVPEKGLMEGEPGKLFLITDPYPDRSEDGEPSLQLELYLDEPQFEDLFTTLVANCDKLEKATMNTVVELFESEVQASLNEPWMTSEYGLLQHDGKDWVSARARIDGIQVAYSKPRPILPLVEDEESDNDDGPDNTEPRIMAFSDENLLKAMQAVRARLGWIIALLLVLLLFVILTA